MSWWRCTSTWPASSSHIACSTPRSTTLCMLWKLIILLVGSGRAVVCRHLPDVRYTWRWNGRPRRGTCKLLMASLRWDSHTSCEHSTHNVRCLVVLMRVCTAVHLLLVLNSVPRLSLAHPAINVFRRGWRMLQAVHYLFSLLIAWQS